MKPEKASMFKVLALASATAALAACGGNSASGTRNETLANYKSGRTEATTVNRYLWTASLETLDFLPVFSADPIAGLIITDWYVNPEAPGERFKTTVYILDSALRADALRVSVFRQAQGADGAWVDASVNPATGREIENAILTRARQLRLNQIDG
jgi:gentisate 1,2-dioxygenase